MVHVVCLLLSLLSAGAGAVVEVSRGVTTAPRPEGGQARVRVRDEVRLAAGGKVVWVEETFLANYDAVLGVRVAAFNGRVLVMVKPEPGGEVTIKAVHFEPSEFGERVVSTATFTVRPQGVLPGSFSGVDSAVEFAEGGGEAEVRLAYGLGHALPEDRVRRYVLKFGPERYELVAPPPPRLDPNGVTYPRPN